ncbi:MAG: PQQ-dependent sugar dehydrogenase [Solirubrobacterales bacterium]|nr:PQQ-dependent sugar dehydrogenase [Solirubrobacterales bacterium]
MVQKMRSGRFLPVVAVTIASFAFSAGALACANDSSPGPDRDQAGSGSAERAVDDAAASANLRTRRIARFDSPVEIKSAPGYPRLMFVVEQPGRIMVLRRGRKLARPFLDIRSKVQHGGERGLLSVAFPPDYRKSGRFYVYFTDHTGDIRIVEYRRRSAVRARQKPGRSVISIRHRTNSNHNGGSLNFLGNLLYFGTGDGGGGGDTDGNAQNLDSLLGKLIRIDPRASAGRPYSVPASNPFVGRDGRDEIFSYGLRNPYRWSFDTTSASQPRIAIGDVGQDEFEEINYLNLSRARGADFGWNNREGFRPYEGGGNNSLRPSLVLPHPPNCSVIGGLVVRDRTLPTLRGRYIFSDFCGGKILSFRPHLGRAGYRDTGIHLSGITSFGQSQKGAVYVTTLSGPVYRIRP